MNGFVNYKGYNASRGPSASIWASCPWSAIVNADVAGTYLWDDFDVGGLMTAPTTIAALGGGRPWSGFSSTGSQVTYDDSSGIVLAETTEDEATNIFQEQHPFNISRSHKSLWLESRIKLSHTATTENSWFVGLMDTTATTAAVPLTATGALADVNLVGFHKPEANTTAYDTSYKANTVTAVEVNSDVGAITAATYFKVGFKYDADTYKLSFYIDGVKQATEKTIPSAAGTDFPNDVALGAVVALAVGAGASDNTLTCDWFRAAQLL